MRLINLDKLLEQVKMRRYTRASLSLLYNQEVVEAIPISWIDSYITDSEIGITANNPKYIKMLIDDWRKENE